MFSIYGWAEIRLNANGEDAVADQPDPMQAIAHFVTDLGFDRDGGVDFVVRNGEHLLRVYIAQNREVGNLERCRQLFDEVVRLAPESYGVLFAHDSDGAPLQTMQRVVMRRGEVVLEDDDIFTPIIPTIEDG